MRSPARPETVATRRRTPMGRLPAAHPAANLHGLRPADIGRIQAFTRTREGNWKWSHTVALPDTAEFEDYAGISYRFGRLAVVSQASARLWIAQVDEKGRATSA